jgi:hypothetical protein
MDTLHRYLSEFHFRYSNRIALGVNNGERRTLAINGASGKRLTYWGASPSLILKTCTALPALALQAAKAKAQIRQILADKVAFGFDNLNGTMQPLV